MRISTVHHARRVRLDPPRSKPDDPSGRQLLLKLTSSLAVDHRAGDGYQVQPAACQDAQRTPATGWNGAPTQIGSHRAPSPSGGAIPRPQQRPCLDRKGLQTVGSRCPACSCLPKSYRATALTNPGRRATKSRASPAAPSLPFSGNGPEAGRFAAGRARFRRLRAAPAHDKANTGPRTPLLKAPARPWPARSAGRTRSARPVRRRA